MDIHVDTLSLSLFLILHVVGAVERIKIISFRKNQEVEDF